VNPNTAASRALLRDVSIEQAPGLARAFQAAIIVAQRELRITFTLHSAMHETHLAISPTADFY
jgi:hypothetical protein